MASIKMEQVPASTDDVLAEYLNRMLNDINYALQESNDYDVLTNIPAKPKIGKQYYFNAAITSTPITAEGWWGYASTGWQQLNVVGGGGGGEINTASNLGAGEGLSAAKSGFNLPFKSLVGGANISLSPSSTEIVINASSNILVMELANTVQTNLNGGTVNACTIPMAWNAAAVTDNSGGALTAGTVGITVASAGTVRITANVYQTSSLARSNMCIQGAVNTTVTGSIGASGYIRNSNGHNESSVHVSLIRTVTAGQVINIYGGRFALAGTVTTPAGLSNLMVEILS